MTQFNAIQSSRDFASLKLDLRQLPVGTILANREYETNLSHSSHWNIEYDTNRRMDSADLVGKRPNLASLEHQGLRTVFIYSRRRLRFRVRGSAGELEMQT